MTSGVVMKNQKFSIRIFHFLAAIAFLVVVRYSLPLRFFNIEIPEVDFLPKPFASHEDYVRFASMAMVFVFMLLRNKIERDISIEVEK